MAQKPNGLARPRRTTAAPPKHLEPPERALWANLLEAYQMDDAAALALLQATMEAHQRARRCRETVDADGEAVKDRFGQTKPHPLLAAERDARASFLAGMRALSLDLGGDR